VNIRPQHAILVRHANAEWPQYVGPDFDRPLTPQGLADARSTAIAIRESGHKPGVLLTSPAKRTLQTAQIIASTLDLRDGAVVQAGELYNAGADILDAELRKAFLSADIVMLVAHNPGISELARMLTGDPTFAAFRPAHWLYVAGPRD
jgi:phosphohistidine phosphatase